MADSQFSILNSQFRRERLISGAFSVWGLAIAIALITFWTRPAPAGQLPGFATSVNLDAHGPFRWIVGLMLLPILVPLALRPLSRRLAAGRAWARNAAIAAMLATLWIVTTYRHLGLAIVPCAIVIAICVLLRDQDLHFRRADAILFPVFLTTLLAVIDIGGMSVNAAVLVAALIVFVVRVAVRDANAFVFAPLALVLQTSFFARDQRYFGWHALAIVVLTPFLVRAFVRIPLRKTLVFFVFPVALYAYANAMSRETAEGKPRVNFFEDGHSLLPASEYLRGERPYRDILPAHGLIEDGGFDFVAMKLGDVNVGTRWRARIVAGNLVSFGLYALAFAVTGSAEAAMLAVLLSIMTGTYTMQLRLLAPLVALTLLAIAIRRRRPRFFFWAGVATVVCGVVSLDYGAFTLITLAIAAIRQRESRRAFLGLVAGAIPLFLAFAVFGILGAFFRGTFLETPAVAPAYVLDAFTPSPLMKSAGAFPDVLAVLFDRSVFFYIFWCATAVLVGVTITRPPRRRFEPLLLLGVWTVLSAISYAERHHTRFGMLAVILLVAGIVWLLRKRSAFAIPAIAAAIALAGPTTHLAVVGWMRQSRGPIEPGWVEVRDLPRARGAFFHEKDVALLASVRKYIALSLKPDETFFDFTNFGTLYFLTRRDCPIREYEVAFYETEAGQREVIRRLESNPKVRAALVSSEPRFTVDGIPNATRAPLVWQYLQQNFEPDFEEGEVVFWKRK